MVSSMSFAVCESSAYLASDRSSRQWTNSRSGCPNGRMKKAGSRRRRVVGSARRRSVNMYIPFASIRYRLALPNVTADPGNENVRSDMDSTTESVCTNLAVRSASSVSTWTTSAALILAPAVHGRRTLQESLQCKLKISVQRGWATLIMDTYKLCSPKSATVTGGDSRRRTMEAARAERW